MTYDGTNLEAIREQARQGRIYAIVWSWRKHRIVRTKLKATRAMQAWKKWHERNGWKVTGSTTHGYVARKDHEAVAISMHKYNAETLARV